MGAGARFVARGIDTQQKDLPDISQARACSTRVRASSRSCRTASSITTAYSPNVTEKSRCRGPPGGVRPTASSVGVRGRRQQGARAQCESATLSASKWSRSVTGRTVRRRPGCWCTTRRTGPLWPACWRRCKTMIICRSPSASYTAIPKPRVTAKAWQPLKAEAQATAHERRRSERSMLHARAQVDGFRVGKTRVNNCQ